jgi:ferric-dicitrate binding protein FerR (iron transport regulator)
MRPLKKLGIAAAVLLIVTAGMYWWLKPSPTQPLPPIAKTDVAPGGNKAVLTLSDGRQIVLNEAANGTLANEGTSVVSKTKDGELEYKSAIGAGQAREQSASTKASADKSAITFNTLSTPRGGQYQLVLPDGSKVWLNAASSITYPIAFTGDERSVNITGEAYFEVAPVRLRSGQKKPFIVNIPGGTVEVLGTHFNVNAYEDEAAIKTTLLEGSVKIMNRETANVKRERPNEFSAVLKPGQQAVLSRANSQLTIHNSPDPDEAVAWLHGQLSMKYIDVAAFMRQVSRWYDVDVVFEGEVPKMSFSGSISKTVNLSLVLKALNDNGLHVSLVNGKLIVKK